MNEAHFVIVGTTIAEATGKYHELVASGEVERGSLVRLAVAHTARRHLNGLRVRGYAFTDAATLHDHYTDLHDQLRRSVLLNNQKNGVK